jgi:Arc/MetJ-type ribon-helix-helix transcriptional regulator
VTIQLKPSQEEAIQAAIASGVFRSVDEFMETALSILPHIPLAARVPAIPRRSRLWELREALSLGDLSIKDLIEEGRE